MAERIDIAPITATVAQFCVISGLSRDSVYKLINSGEVRSVIICGRRLIDLDSYRALIARSRQHTSAKRGGMGGGKCQHPNHNILIYMIYFSWYDRECPRHIAVCARQHT